MDEKELKELIETMERQWTEHQVTREGARQVLIEEGLITDTGELTEFYR